MVDKIEHFHGSLVQHGPHNDRIYIMHLAPENTVKLLPDLDQLALRQGYGKIFAKIPATSWDLFLQNGYTIEAEIPCLFEGNADCYFVAKFFAGRQHTNEDFSDLLKLTEQPLSNALSDKKNRELDKVRPCNKSDADELASFYRTQFTTYPFPVFDPSYLREVIGNDIHYYCIRENSKIVAAAATELCKESQYAEMTDFATLPEWRGKGLAACLLRKMDRASTENGIHTVFTIARACSYGMNKVFQNGGYQYSGLLINNTQISGKIESMAVWHKQLG